MLNNVTNECAINGYVYDFGRFGLNIKKDAEHGDKIYGSIIVLVDEPTDTTVEVHFFPQGKEYKSGKENATYLALKELMDNKNTIAAVGKSKAAKVRCTCKLSTNIYYSANKAKQNELELHEPLQVQGSFLHIDDNAVPFVGFNVDALIKSLTPINDANGEPSADYRVNIEIFDDYRKIFRPLTMKISDPAGVAVFTRNVEDQPYYTTIAGTIVNRTIQKATQSGEMEFGQATVISQPREVRDILITGAKTATKGFNMSDEEMVSVKNNRKVQLNDALKRAEERANNKAATSTATSAAKSVADDFNF